MLLEGIHDGCVDRPRTTIFLDTVAKQRVDNYYKWILGLKPFIHYVLEFGIVPGTKSLYPTVTSANWFFQHAVSPLSY